MDEKRRRRIVPGGIEDARAEYAFDRTTAGSSGVYLYDEPTKWFGESDRWRKVQARLVKASNVEDFVSILTEETPVMLGVCWIKTPTKPLRPVLKSDGLRWCCSHEDTHCTEVLAELQK